MVVITTFFGLAFIFASFLEYWIHRLFHLKSTNPLKRIFPNIGQGHTKHHLDGSGQGVIWEFRDYFLGTSLLMFLMFFYSWEAGISWFLGSFFYAGFAAYAHQLQHDNPTKCFWMKMPVHYVHHKYDQWNHNFGIGVDWWDRIFQTYQEVDWLSEPELSQAKQGLFAIKWY
jgi:sterol desaturase/sphingolipid hydroxylase (fatty acid hydroxylase superfamily)